MNISLTRSGLPQYSSTLQGSSVIESLTSLSARRGSVAISSGLSSAFWNSTSARFFSASASTSASLRVARYAARRSASAFASSAARVREGVRVTIARWGLLSMQFSISSSKYLPSTPALILFSASSYSRYISGFPPYSQLERISKL